MTNTNKVVVRKRLSDQATSLIKQKILTMQYLPGQRLFVDKLAEELDVSRTPVRDGLSALVENGLVEYNGTSYTVFKPTIQGVKDIFEIRAVLESLSVKQAVKKMPPGEIRELKSLFLDTETLIVNKSLNELIELDIYFHDSIMNGAANNKLRKLLHSIREQCWMIRRWGFGHKEVVIEKTTVDEHIRIVDAMVEQDGEKAASLMHAHLINSGERILELPEMKRLTLL